MEISWHTHSCPPPPPPPHPHTHPPLSRSAVGHNDGNILKLFNCGSQLSYTLLPFPSKRRHNNGNMLKLLVMVSWHTLYCPLPAKGHNDWNILKLFSCGDQLAYTLLPPASERTQRLEYIKTIQLWRSAGIHSTAPCQRKDTTIGIY